MRGLERFTDLSGNRQRLVHRDRAMLNAIGESWPLHHLEHERLDVIRGLEAVNCGDVRMIQRREEIGLPREPRQTIRIAGEKRRQNLERDLARQPAVARQIHLAHAAGADERDDFVAAEPGAWLESHDSRWNYRHAVRAAASRSGRSPRSEDAGILFDNLMGNAILH